MRIISLPAVTAEAVRRGGWITKMEEFGMRPVTGRAQEGAGGEGGVGARETATTDQC